MAFTLLVFVPATGAATVAGAVKTGDVSVITNDMMSDPDAFAAHTLQPGAMKPPRWGANAVTLRFLANRVLGCWVIVHLQRLPELRLLLECVLQLVQEILGKRDVGSRRGIEQGEGRRGGTTAWFCLDLKKFGDALPGALW